MENLWPQFHKKQEQTPKAILEQQAEYFNNLNLGLRAYVTRELGLFNDLIYSFRIQSSALDGYTITLVRAINSPTNIYPVSLVNAIKEQKYDIENPEDLQNSLKSIFNSSDIVEIINNLVTSTSDEGGFF